MSIRHTLSTILVSVALFAAQGASAQDIQFFQKNAEVAASGAHVAGKLAVRMTINADGSVDNVRVTRSSGDASIDNRAVAWMEDQVVRPMTMNGEPQVFSVVKEIKFSHDGAMQLGLKK